MDNRYNKQELHFLGSGWSFPVTFSAGNQQLLLTRFEENINESINVIFQTRIGERFMEPQFGSGLQQFFFRKMDETLKGEIEDAVKVALLNNEPRITVEEILVDFVENPRSRVEINIVYIYNQTNTRHNYVFPFHLIEGTNLEV